MSGAGSLVGLDQQIILIIILIIIFVIIFRLNLYVANVRKARKAHLINKAKTLHPLGINRRDETRQWHVSHF